LRIFADFARLYSVEEHQDIVKEAGMTRSFSLKKSAATLFAVIAISGWAFSLEAGSGFLLDSNGLSHGINSLFANLASSQAGGQAILRGYVRSALIAGGIPQGLQGVRVLVIGETYPGLQVAHPNEMTDTVEGPATILGDTTTNSSGYYEVSVPPGDYKVIFWCAGYVPVTHNAALSAGVNEPIFAYYENEERPIKPGATINPWQGGPTHKFLEFDPSVVTATPTPAPQNSDLDRQAGAQPARAEVPSVGGQVKPTPKKEEHTSQKQETGAQAQPTQKQETAEKAQTGAEPGQDPAPNEVDESKIFQVVGRTFRDLERKFSVEAPPGGWLMKTGSAARAEVSNARLYMESPDRTAAAAVMAGTNAQESPLEDILKLATEAMGPSDIIARLQFRMNEFDGVRQTQIVHQDGTDIFFLTAVLGSGDAIFMFICWSDVDIQTETEPLFVSILQTLHRIE
jgi:hypothetical protein